MPRYMIERTFTDGLNIPVNKDGCMACTGVVDNNAEEQVTWIHSYVSNDKTQTFCVYDGPSEAAIRKAAERNGLPVNKVTEVRVLDPYFYY